MILPFSNLQYLQSLYYLNVRQALKFTNLHDIYAIYVKLALTIYRYLFTIYIYIYEFIYYYYRA